MSMLDTVEWHHGTISESCNSDGPTPVGKLGKKRMRSEQIVGKNKGKTGVYADCPKCGRWVWIGTEGGE